ncbi:MAG: hypothetical protein SCALA702_23670 [Melioribacteraceae bacterium]|nr:MAG: hypothetical protein SCALA702_23670 [Melioribacteraceae bacterium]
MKIALFLLILIFSSVTLLAQEQETLLKTDRVDHGGYGALAVKFSQINEKFGVLVGGYGGWLINHSLMVGAGGYGLANRIPADDEVQLQSPDKILDIQFGYGGFMLEYIFDPNRLIHYNVKMLIGAGGAGYSLRDDFNATDTKQTAVFVMEIDANIEMNVTEYMRICLGAAYRHVGGNDLEGLADSDLAGPSGVVTFKFGSF